jgi:hypothetical protein
MWCRPAGSAIRGPNRGAISLGPHARHCRPCPGRKTGRPYDQALFAARHLIGNFVCQLKQFCAIVTRYDKLP